jgi:hypothetical protein
MVRDAAVFPVPAIPVKCVEQAPPAELLVKVSQAIDAAGTDKLDAVQRHLRKSGKGKRREDVRKAICWLRENGQPEK